MTSIEEYVKQEKKQLSSLILEAKYIKNKIPHLGIIQIGDNKVAFDDVERKIADCKELGIKYTIYRFKDTITEKKLFKDILKINNKTSIDAITIASPIPAVFDHKKIKKILSPEKSVDGFHPQLLFYPCIAVGIVNYLKNQNILLSGRNVTIIEENNTLSKNLTKLFFKDNCNILILHSKVREKDFKNILLMSDIIISASGKKNLLKKSYQYKKNAIILDAGKNFDDSGNICGDCEQDLDVRFQSPVPNGINLLTRLTLMQNVFKAFALLKL